MKPVAIFRHSSGEGPGYFATFLERHGVPWQLIKVDAGDALPPDADAFAGLAFMGGPMSVNDPLDWVTQECALIAAAVHQDIPTLGHCLGGQLMAKALGATVTRNPVKEIGWGKVDVADSSAARTWFGATRIFEAFHWHGETFALPSAASPILSSPYCAHQAFALGPHLAMQCHIEMTTEMIEQWCTIGAAEIAANPGPAVQVAATMQAGMTAKLAALGTVADQIYSRWIAGLRT